MGNPVSSTTKTGCHDIAEILLKVALKHQKSNQSCYSNINATLAAKIHVGRLKFTGIILQIDKCWLQVLWSLNQPSLDIKGSLSLIPETNFGQGILCNL